MTEWISRIQQNADARPLRAIGASAIAGGWFVLLAVISARIAGAALSRQDTELLATLVIALLVSGAALVAVDALRTGFGALDRFFEAALARSARRTTATVDLAETDASAGAASRHGFIGDRPYVLHADGAVIVETLLGARRFGTLSEAREFIGA